MRGYLALIASIATGILIAAAVLAGGWYILSPASSITIDLTQYSCATDGKIIKCRRG